MRRRYKKNPVVVTYVDGLILIGIGAVVGGLGYWLYTKNQDDDTPSGAVPIGSDTAGNVISVTPTATGGIFSQSGASAPLPAQVGAP
jgi:hypothetical protein